MTNHESIGLGLSEYIATGDWRIFFLQRDEVQTGRRAQVQASARASTWCVTTARWACSCRRTARVAPIFRQAASAAELLKQLQAQQQ